MTWREAAVTAGRWIAGFTAAGLVVGSVLWWVLDGSWGYWFLWAGVLAAMGNLLRWTTATLGRRARRSSENAGALTGESSPNNRRGGSIAG